MTGWFGSPGSAVGRVPVTVVGCDGGPLSPAAEQALAAADLVVGGRRHLDAVALSATARTVVMGPVDVAANEIAKAHHDGERVVVLASGDPGYFGIVRRLSGRQGGHVELRVLPAVSSVAAAFGRLGLPWDDAVVVSAHGRPLAPAVNAWRRYSVELRRVAVLTDTGSGPVALLDALGEDFTGCEVLERLGEPDEGRATVLTQEPTAEVLEASQAAGREVVGPAGARSRQWREPLLLVSPGRVVGSAPWLAGQRVAFGDEPSGWALPDSAFVHRDGMLTKRDVRAAVLARLAPAVGTLVWDVGAGSGSVAVECSRLGSAVIAVERDPEALQRISDNAAALYGPVKVVPGSAPEALVGLPWPDAVFVGGGGPDVVAAVAAIRPERVVVALATVERVAPTVAALDGYLVDTVLLQVHHLQPLGEGHRLVPANPVFVVSGALP